VYVLALIMHLWTSKRASGVVDERYLHTHTHTYGHLQTLTDTYRHLAIYTYAQTQTETTLARRDTNHLSHESPVHMHTDRQTDRQAWAGCNGEGGQLVCVQQNRMYVFAYVCVHMYICMYICTYVCICAHACIMMGGWNEWS